MKKASSIIGPAAILLLLTLGFITEALAINIYHFLVQYKNGRIAEKISTHSAKNYKSCYEGYVEKVVLLNKKEYSLQQFIQTFGPRNYHLFMSGHFGCGLEEEIIFSRNAGGLGVNPLALPPPDGESKLLAKKLDRILHGDHEETDTHPLDKSTLSNPGSLSAQGNEPDSMAEGSLQEGGIDLPVDLPLESPMESDEKEILSVKIDIYRFIAEYINGGTVEKVSTRLPEEYHKLYRGYVRKIVSSGKETYTVKEFKKKFGEKNFNLLIQGLFGKDDTDLVMENRIKRGIAPHPSALPVPSKKTITLAKKTAKSD